METINVLDMNNVVSNIIMNAFCEVTKTKEGIEKHKDSYETGGNLQCELKIGGLEVPIAYFFQKIYDDYEAEIEKAAAKKLQEMIYGNSIIHEYYDLQDKLKITMNAIGEELQQFAVDKLDMKFDADGYREY